MVSVPALLLSVGTSFTIFAVLVIVHLWLSSYSSFAFLYFPAKVKKGLEVEKYQDVKTWTFGSISEVFHTSDREVERMAGLDASIYLQFLRTGLKISCTACCFAIFVLLPACATDTFYQDFNSKQTDPSYKIKYDTLDVLSMGNVSKTSPRIWAFVAGAWWISIFTFYFLFEANKAISKQLAEFNKMKYSHVGHFSILVRDIPKPLDGKSLKEQVKIVFQNLYPQSYVDCIIIPPLSKIMLAWNDLQEHRKKVQAEQLTSKNGGSHQTSGESSGSSIQEPFLSDPSSILSSKEEKLFEVWKTEKEQALKKNQKCAAFVFFNSRKVAAQASQVLYSYQGDSWIVSPAPDPKSVRWSHLAISVYERTIRRALVSAAVFIIVVFYLIPASFVSALANVSSLEKKFQFLSPILKIPYLKQILGAYLPQLALQQFLSFIPFVLKFLASREGHPSEARVLKSASGSIFMFLVLNVFLGVSISGTLFSTLQQILQQPAHVFELLGSSVPSNASFFITYVALIFYVSHGLELSQLSALVQYKLFNFTRIASEKDMEKYVQPVTPAYHLLVPRDLLIMTLGLCYAVIAPMILPFMALYFGFALLVYRHQFLNVYVAPWDGEGFLWPELQTWVLGALVVSQLTLIGYFGLNGSLTTLSIVPLPFATSFFGWFLNTRFSSAFRHTPLEVLQTAEVDVPILGEFLKAFNPECLSESNICGGLPASTSEQGRMESA